jgi:hypothetical protein
LIPAVAVAVLVLAAGVQIAMPSAAAVPARPHVAAAAPTTDTARPIPQMYRAIMAHPIFAPDRAPPPAEADDASNLSGVEVLGTAIAGKSAAALVRDSEGTFTRVKVGEEIEGWKLVSIEKQLLVFDRNGERRTLNLDVARLKSQPATGPGATKPGAFGATGAAPTTTTDDTDDSDDDDQ